MKLISIFFTKKTLAVALFILIITFTYARTASTVDMRRVFWNKFEANLTDDNTVVLTWNVTEYNNKKFLVQHSMNGIDWEDIAMVSSKQNTQPMVDYSYTYINKLSGKQYYRLMDLDVDVNSTGYSPVRTVISKYVQQSITIWPNPATDHIIVANSDNKNLYTKASIYNLTGKLVAESKLGSENNEIAINQLPAGFYMVKIENANGTCYSQKIVKQ